MNLVFENNGNIVTTSLLVAEKFGKEHRHVLESIRNLVAENSAAKSLFQESYFENRGKSYPMYILNRDGFSLLVMGFTGKKALDFKLEYIDAFNKMEKRLKSLDFSDAGTVLQLAQNWHEEQQKRIEAERINTENIPKVLFADSVTASTDVISVNELSTILKQNGIDIGQNRLFDWLRSGGYLISRKGRDWNTPTQRGMNLGLFEVRESSVNRSAGIKVNLTTVVTGKGQLYFINKFLNQKLSA